MKSFKGSTEEIGATMSLPTEKVNSDRGFEHFTDLMENYILKNMTNATDVIPLITEMKDPTTDFVKDNMPDPQFSDTEVVANPL